MSCNFNVYLRGRFLSRKEVGKPFRANPKFISQNTGRNEKKRTGEVTKYLAKFLFFQKFTIILKSFFFQNGEKTRTRRLGGRWRKGWEFVLKIYIFSKSGFPARDMVFNDKTRKCYLFTQVLRKKSLDKIWNIRTIFIFVTLFLIFSGAYLSFIVKIKATKLVNISILKKKWNQRPFYPVAY